MPLPSTRGPEESTPSNSALAQAIPAPLHAPSHWDVPTRSTPPNPLGRRRRARGARRAGSAWPHGLWRLPTARGTPPRRCLPRRTVLRSVSGVNPPLKHTSSTRSRRSAPASGARRAVRAALGDAAAPFRWRTGSMDGGRSRCSLVGTSRHVTPCRGWRRSSRRMRSLHSSCTPLAEGLHHTGWPYTTGPHRPAAPGRRVALRADRRR